MQLGTGQGSIYRIQLQFYMLAINCFFLAISWGKEILSLITNRKFFLILMRNCVFISDKCLYFYGVGFCLLIRSFYIIYPVPKLSVCVLKVFLQFLQFEEWIFLLIQSSLSIFCGQLRNESFKKSSSSVGLKSLPFTIRIKPSGIHVIPSEQPVVPAHLIVHFFFLIDLQCYVYQFSIFGGIFSGLYILFN